MGDGVGDAQEVARDEHVRERAQERAEGAVAAGRGGELLGADLVRSPSDRDGADRGEVRLGARGPWIRYGAVLGAVPGWYDLR